MFFQTLFLGKITAKLAFPLLRQRDRRKPQFKRSVVEARLADLEKQATDNYRDSIRTVSRLINGNLRGSWVCHSCLQKSLVTILPDSHPLGILYCKLCNHIWCAKCPSSFVLQYWYASGINLSRTINPRELPYVFLCDECGLTWRAVVEREVRKHDGVEMHWGWGHRKCNCGARPSFWKPWVCFRIGGEAMGGGTRMMLRTLREELNETDLDAPSE